MIDNVTTQNDDELFAARLRTLRLAQNWPLDELSKRSGISRATLSRIEKGDVSPTTHVLGKLCTAYGLTLSRLMVMVETSYEPVLTRSQQPVWVDSTTGFQRRSVSPPSENLSCEVLECVLEAGASIQYAAPPSAGLEHHLVMLQGGLEVEIEGIEHSLLQGDCLRYKLYGASAFRAHKTEGAKYHLVIL